MNPKNAYIESSIVRLKEMVWENFDNENVDNGKGKRQRVYYKKNDTVLVLSNVLAVSYF